MIVLASPDNPARPNLPVGTSYCVLEVLDGAFRIRLDDPDSLATSATRHPNGNIFEQTVDHGDGTGTLTVYDDTGQVVSTEQLTGLPYDPPTIPDDALLDITDIRDTTRLRSTT